MIPFDPLFRNPHLLTMAANFWPGRLDERRFPVQAHFRRTAPDAEVLVLTQRPQAPARGAAVLVHGLEGSGNSRYMRTMAQALLEAGYAVHRFHLRGCGGGQGRCNTFYHAGLTSDLRPVLEDCGEPVHLIGYSLGGNVVLKLAGELGDCGGELLRSVCAVSVPIDLAASADRIDRPDNRIYQRRFLAAMGKRLRSLPAYRKVSLRGIRSIREFDDRFTAPSFGFRSAGEYYRTQSAAGYLDRVQVPTLVVQAKDDSFIPFACFAHPAFSRNPHLRLLATEHGGHVGFIARRPPRLWLEQVAVEWLETAIL